MYAGIDVGSIFAYIRCRHLASRFHHNELASPQNIYSTQLNVLKSILLVIPIAELVTMSLLLYSREVTCDVSSSVEPRRGGS